MTTARVTIVVMVRDGWQDLVRTLPRHEGPVVLVDNGSTDGTPELVRSRFPHVRVVELGGNRGAPARNVGVEAARTQYVAFADDDSWWAPGALERAADVLDRHRRLALLAGRMTVEPDHRTDPVSEAMAASPLGTAADLPGPSILGFLACGAVVRCDPFLAVGGFDPVVFFMGEEERVALDLAAAGWGLAYVEDVVAHHQPAAGRDRSGRAAGAAGNHLLTAVMRRPLASVLATARADLRTPTGRRGLRRALPLLPLAWRHRAVVPADVERALRSLAAH
jgi:GT2 family glycosyltransferase